MIVVVTLLSLFGGLLYGLSGLDVSLVSAIGNHTDWILYALMFTVGISIGMQRGMLSKIREYHFKIFIIPTGVIIGSFIGGILCAWMFELQLPVGWDGTALPVPPLVKWVVPNWEVSHL